ncbi:MAG: hopanoid biosynthesis-associated protein HpnK [Hyphomicrobiales bacterium]|nr:hopanoid biosynthesis-associated protein HpnK [Hyphomicrobiales bacterium]MBV9426782.1 hopanoid biosynthesis-associated protein HpnK [Bradyrhizobiaceae bacterium]
MSGRKLIITGDDFGMSVEVNEAVEEAHRRGVLTSASLVMAGEAAADAIARARRMPALGVGLHVALLHAPAALSKEQVADLLDENGCGFSRRTWKTGCKLALFPHVRRQALAEVRAQFELFRKTGLALDHVDGHKHFHQHPWLLAALIALAPEYRIRAIRLPREPALCSWRAAGRVGLGRRLLDVAGHWPLLRLMRRVLRSAGIVSNDWFFGKHDGGAIGRNWVLRLLEQLPPGVSEIGLHPARRSWPPPYGPPTHWRVTDELEALIDPDVVAACRRPGVRLAKFSDLSAETVPC